MAESIGNELVKIFDVLNSNSRKNFVQRILNPSNYPVLDYGDENYATHKMSWSTANGKNIIYPTVVHDTNNNQLVELTPEQAIQYAIHNNEYIEVATPEEAEWFSQNYKKVWTK